MLEILFDYGFYIIVFYFVFILFSEWFQKMFSLFKKNKYKFSIHFFVCFLSIIQFFMMRVIQNNEYSMYFGAMFITFLFFIVINYFFYLFPFKVKMILSTIFNIFLWFVCVSEKYIVKFKGEPYTINDIKALKMAITVVSNYDFTPSFSIILGTFILLIIILINFLIRDSFESIPFRFSFCFVFFLIVFSSLIINRENIEKIGNINVFNKNVATTNYGYPLYLAIDGIYNRFEYPKGYNEEQILEKIDSLEVSEIDKEKTSAVNVICVLDEAFYDLSLLTVLDTNEDFMPFYHSDNIKNTLKGYSIVSTIGGGTANTEYEFLMQGNLRFLPTSSYPFSTYINKEASSLATILKDRGFRTVAYHPFERTNWNRDFVYSLIGFDEFLDENDYDHKDTFSFVGDNFLIDKVCFSDIIDIYENKENDENLFVYCVTMQNHSPYFQEDESMYLDSIRDSFFDNVEVNHYLSLLKHTDDAIKELFEYFDNIDEPTIILVVGDHSPGTLIDYDGLNLDLRQKLFVHSTPFLIHTNFDTDIPELGSEFISVSYLQSILMDMANIKKDKEQVFVQSYMDKYPILSSSLILDNGNLVENHDIPDDLIDYRDYCYTKLNKKQ